MNRDQTRRWGHMSFDFLGIQNYYSVTVKKGLRMLLHWANEYSA